MGKRQRTATRPAEALPRRQGEQEVVVAAAWQGEIDDQFAAAEQLGVTRSDRRPRDRGEVVAREREQRAVPVWCDSGTPSF